MRDTFCRTLLAHAGDPRFVFLTGDLGFMALEPLREALGPRFLNAGVAEQNMVAVAAGLAKTGLRPWAYSIASFLCFRPFEQIRNDVCLHDLPVMLVGNGGGYGYGVMGSTHHAIGDYGALLTLPNIRACIPAFDEDIAPMIGRLFADAHPCYLRLGVSEKPKDMEMPAYAPWRRLLRGDRGCLLAVGPLAGSVLGMAARLGERDRPTIWVLTELPLGEPPAEFFQDIERVGPLMVAEEHVACGGVGSMLALDLLGRGKAPKRFLHRFARGYVSERYGSQQFHRRESGLDADSILRDLARACDS